MPSFRPCMGSKVKVSHLCQPSSIPGQVSHNLNSLIKGGYLGEHHRGYSGDGRSLVNGSGV